MNEERQPIFNGTMHSVLIFVRLTETDFSNDIQCVHMVTGIFTNRKSFAQSFYFLVQTILNDFSFRSTTAHVWLSLWHYWIQRSSWLHIFFLQINTLTKCSYLWSSSSFILCIFKLWTGITWICKNLERSEKRTSWIIVEIRLKYHFDGVLK